MHPFWAQNGSGKVNGFQKDTDDSAILFFGKKSGLWSSSVRKCFHKIAKFAGNCVPPKLSACVSSAKLRKCIVVLAYLARDFKGKSTSLRNIFQGTGTLQLKLSNFKLYDILAVELRMVGRCSKGSAASKILQCL